MKKLFRKRSFRGLMFLALSGLLSTPLPSARFTNDLVGDIQGFGETLAGNVESKANELNGQSSQANQRISRDLNRAE